MKKYQGLFIPEHAESNKQWICCGTAKCGSTHMGCGECLFDNDEIFNQWLSNNRPTDEDNKECKN